MNPSSDMDRAFPVLGSKGAAGQIRIEAVPDERWEYTGCGESPILEKAGHLLVSMGQRVSTARLTSVASDKRYVGQGWMPVTGLGAAQAKALAVYLNSTPGRLLLMGNLGKSLDFPFYNPAVWRSIGIPDVWDDRIRTPLADCWEGTRYETVPQYRDGYTAIRQAWDRAVCSTLGWDIEETSRLGAALHDEPRVRGLAIGQWRA